MSVFTDFRSTLLGPPACSVLRASPVGNFKRVLCVRTQGIGCLFGGGLCCVVPDYGFFLGLILILCVFLCGYMIRVGALGILGPLEVESSVHLLWEGGPELCKPTILYLGLQQRARDNVIVVLFARHYGRESGVSLHTGSTQC